MLGMPLAECWGVWCSTCVCRSMGRQNSMSDWLYRVVPLESAAVHCDEQPTGHCERWSQAWGVTAWSAEESVWDCCNHPQSWSAAGIHHSNIQISCVVGLCWKRDSMICTVTSGPRSMSGAYWFRRHQLQMFLYTCTALFSCTPASWAASVTGFVHQDNPLSQSKLWFLKVCPIS